MRATFCPVTFPSPTHSGLVAVTHGRPWARRACFPRWDLVQFLQLVQDYRVTRAYLVPPMVLALAKQSIVDQFDLSTLKTIGCAAALSQEVARACGDRLGCRIKQLYGMTEVGITHIAPDDLDWSKLGTVGVRAAQRMQDRRPGDRG